MRFKVYIGDDCIGFFSDYDHRAGVYQHVRVAGSDDRRYSYARRTPPRADLAMLLKTLYSKDSGSKSVPRIIPKVWDRYKVLYFLMFVFWCVLGVVVGVVWVLSTSALYVAPVRRCCPPV